MKFRIYANGIDEKILTEEEYLQDIEKQANELIKSEVEVEEFLKDCYCYYEIFNFSEEKKAEVLEDMKNCFIDEIFEQREKSGDWIYRDIEI